MNLPRLAVTDEASSLSSRIFLAQGKILELVSSGAEVSEVFNEFCAGLENLFPDSSSCVTVVDPATSSLEVLAAPSLPEAFRESINGLTVGLAPGACCAAAYGNETIISDDLHADLVWEGLREEALAAGLGACWSTPIRGVRWAEKPDEHDHIVVLGTVALYFPGPRGASSGEIQALETAAALAGLTINTARTTEPTGDRQFFDSVTKLPNRRIFSKQLKQTLLEMNPRDDKLAILVVDIDHFKEVNDTFGYAVGDFLLQSVSERLVGLRSEIDLLARFGDDEFAFLIGEVASGEDVKTIAQKVLDVVSAAYDFGGQELVISASIGGSVFPWDGEDAQTLMRNAENALVSAKKQGRGLYRMYAPTMGGYAFEKLQLKMALSYAIENDELMLRFQPKVSSNTNTIVGVEALTYWNHPGMGEISPTKFIPIAEETGQIIPLGEWVLRTACKQAQVWHREYDDLTMAINISAIQFRERNFVATVASILRDTEVQPGAIELEVTESVAMNEVEKTLERLQELHDLGVQIAIDDFGTGYSSLAYLKRFPIHTLKIDRSFVLSTPKDKGDMAIVKGVIALAHNLGLEVVAEGVETAEQAEYLRDEGCEILQGFHFSRPVPLEAFERLLRFGFPTE
ncbi:MAG: EAL domain-containing protein [bacterium]|nr:EAL domain-containing protein [bacterium]